MLEYGQRLTKGYKLPNWIRDGISKENTCDAQLGERTTAVCDLNSKIPFSVHSFSNLSLLRSDNISTKALNFLLAFLTRLKAIFERERLQRQFDHADV